MSAFEQRTMKGYDLLEELGAGGFGAVYRAHQSLLKRDVAIKVILPEHANKPDFVRRFETEAELIARLEHPHIVPIYDYWRDPDGAYIVMRYIHGRNLAERLMLKPLSNAEMVQIVEQLAKALHFAHRHQVVHRDIKPENVLLDGDGNAYLVDFGIAKDLSQDVIDETEGAGTLMYASPEQIIGEAITPQTDLYSFGLLVYELLTGALPHENTTAHAIKQLQFREDLPENDNISETIMTVLRRATRQEPEERYYDAMDFASAFRQAQSSTSLQLAVTQVAEQDIDLVNPYKGLMAFQEYDSQDFFGRNTLIERLLSRLRVNDENARFLAVVGPSGSGKSSVVKAGVIPQIRQGALPGSEDWYVLEMTPGSRPFDELEVALIRIATSNISSLHEQLMRDEYGLSRALNIILPDDATKFVLVIDQFEELFTQVESEEARQHFINSLLAALEDKRERFLLFVTLRADFYDKPLQYHEFGDLLRKRSEIVLPLSDAELAEVIQQPAEQRGARLQPGLLDAIVRDVRESPGILPLLQFTLMQLFEKREGRTLTLRAYAEMGGVTGALATQADMIYESLSEVQQQSTRQLFLRLVTLGEGTEDTRRRVQQTALSQIEDIDTILAQFGKVRLLTFDRDAISRVPTVEVAHEALIRNWQRFKDWINESRDDLRLQRTLTQTTAEWLEHDRDPGFLARDARLAQFETWLAHTALILSPDEQAFLEESLVAQAARETAERERKTHEAKIARRAQNFERASLVLGAMVVLAIVAVVGAVFQSAEAQSQLATATLAQGEALNAQGTALARVGEANTQVAFAGETLTPIPATLDVVATTVQDARNFADSVLLAARAQTIYDSGNQDTGLALAMEASYLNGAPRTEFILRSIAYQPASQRYFTGHIDRVNRVGFNPTGTQILSASEDDTMILWDIKSGESIRRFEGHSGAIADMSWSANGQRIVSGSAEVLVWDVATGEVVQRFEEHEFWASAVAISPDGRLAVSVAAYMYLWDVATGEILREFAGHHEEVTRLLFSPDGSAVLSASHDGTIVLWDVATGDRLETFAEHDGTVLDVQFSADGSRLLSMGKDNIMLLWDIENAEVIRRYRGHSGTLSSVAVSRDGRFAVSGVCITRDVTTCTEGNVYLWDVASGEILRRYDGHSGDVLDVAFSPDGQSFLSGSTDKSMLLQTVTSGRGGDVVRQFEGHQERVHAAVFSPDGRRIASASADETILVWDATNGAILQRFEGHADIITSVAFSPDGTYLYSSSCGVSEDWHCIEGETLYWHIESGEIVHRLAGHTDWTNVVAISPDGTQLLSGADDARILLWDSMSGELIRSFEGHTDWVTDIAFSPDGTQIVSGSSDSTMRLWDVATGEMLRQFSGHSQGINSVAISPDGTQLLSGAEDNAVLLWDAQSGAILRRYAGHSQSVWGVAFRPDGTQLLSGADDNTMILWDVASGDILHRFEGHSQRVWSVAFSPAAYQVLSGSWDNTMILWRLDSLEQLQLWTRENRSIAELSCEERLIYDLPAARQCTEDVPPPSPTLQPTRTPSG